MKRKSIKVCLSIVFTCFAFFFSFFDVKAATNSVVLSDLYDSNGIGTSVLGGYNGYVFNYFYEERKDTPIANFVEMLLTNYSLYFQKEYKVGTGFTNIFYPNFFIFYRGEIDYICDNYSYPDGSPYAEYYSEFCSSLNDNTNYIIFSYYYDEDENESISLEFNSDKSVILNVPISSAFQYIELDKSANVINTSDLIERRFSEDNIEMFTHFLERYKFYYTWNEPEWYEFWKSDDYSGSDFSLLYSKYIYSADNNYIKLHSSYSDYSLESYAFVTVGNKILTDFSKRNLDYLDSYPIISSKYNLLTLYDLYFKYEKINIPSSFTAYNLNDYYSIALVPKRYEDLKFSDYYIYYYSDHNTKLLRSYVFPLEYLDNDYSASDIQNDTFPTIDYSEYPLYANSRVENNFGLTSSTLKNDITPLLMFKSSDFRGFTNIYINKDAFDVYLFKDLSFSNTIIGYGTDNTFIFTGEQLNNWLINAYDFGKNYNYSGVSCSIFEYFDGENCVPIGTSGTITVEDPDNPGSFIPVDDNPLFSTAWSADDMLNLAWGSIQSFINACSLIIQLSTSLFLLLPASIGSLLVTTFVLGMVLLIWKIMH